MSFSKFVFLNFLNIRKDYYKSQQHPLKPPTKNDTVSFKESAQKFFFKNTFKNWKVFWKFESKNLENIFLNFLDPPILHE